MKWSFCELRLLAIYMLLITRLLELSKRLDLAAIENDAKVGVYFSVASFLSLFNMPPLTEIDTDWLRRTGAAAAALL